MRKVSRLKLAREFVSMLDDHSLTRMSQALAQQVIEQRFTRQVDLLLKDVTSELLRQKGRLEVDVTTVHKLTAAIRAELSSFLKSQSGARSVHFNEHQNPAILGGLVAETSELALDLSIKTQLERLKV